MEFKYKNRTYWIESIKTIFGSKEICAQYLGYSAYGATKEIAAEKVHQMIEEDNN